MARTWFTLLVFAGLGFPTLMAETPPLTNSPPLVQLSTNRLLVYPGQHAELTVLLHDAETPHDLLEMELDVPSTPILDPSEISITGAGQERVIRIPTLPLVSDQVTFDLRVTDEHGTSSETTLRLLSEPFSWPPPVPRFRGDSVSAVGDLDGDGTFDLVCADGIRWGTNLFLHAPMLGGLLDQYQWPGFEPRRHYALFDMDNDNRLDLLSIREYSPYSEGSPFVLLNRSGHFERVDLAEMDYSETQPRFCDFNGDGRMDVIAPSAQGVLFTNHMTGFGALTNGLLEALTNYYLLPGDIDNDGDSDLIFAGVPQSGSGILLNQAGVSLGMSVERLSGSEVVDVNNDGKFDVLGSTVFFQREHGVFDFDYSADVSGGKIGDFNNDGFADTANSINNQDESFLETDWGTYPRFVEAADMDRDGDLDLVSLSSAIHYGYVYYNNLNRFNLAPTSPADLKSAVLPHNQVEFTWRPGTDPETDSSGGLSYNLRVGRTPGGTEVLSPLYNESTGTLLKPFRGNAGIAPVWRLRNLPRGTYYWSVQAIDHGLATSPFAPEASFEITEDLGSSSNVPPQITAATLTAVEDESVFIPHLAFDADGDPTEMLWSPQFDHSPPTAFDYLFYVTALGNFWPEADGWRFTFGTNFYGTLRIPVRAYDGRSYSPVQEIVIDIAPRQDRLLPPSVGILTWRTGSSVVTLHGEPYGTYALETSTNLLDWTAETTVQFDYRNNHSHVEAFTSPKKFFRMRFLE